MALSLAVLLPTRSSTYLLGASLGRAARAGDAVLLDGGIGIGKTVFAQGFLRALYGDPRLRVPSPSYLIDHTYPEDADPRTPAACARAAPIAHHMDLWRLEGGGGAAAAARAGGGVGGGGGGGGDDGGVERLVDLDHVFNDCVSLIEWPDRLRPDQVPATRLSVRFLFGRDEGGRGGEGAGHGAFELVHITEDADDEDDFLLDDDDDDVDADDTDATNGADGRMAILTAHGGARWEERLAALALLSGVTRS